MNKLKEKTFTKEKTCKKYKRKIITNFTNEKY